jgi:deoxyribodipyrimidine photo-lyase
MSRAFVWFRNDLRLADNEALTAALAAHDEVLPIAIIDPVQHGASPFGFARSGDIRRRAWHQNLEALGSELRSKGSALRVYYGDPCAVLMELAAQWNTSIVHVQTLCGWEEQQQEQAVASVLELRTAAPNTLLHPADLPFTMDRLPHVFTEFRKQVEKRWKVRDLLHGPEQVRTQSEWTGKQLSSIELPFTDHPPDPRASSWFAAGRGAALQRLQHYLWDTRALSRYKETRNGLLGADFSSKFSPWLASGALSAREVYHAVKRYEAEHGANESTYWLIFELLWRDFFQFTAAKLGKDLFTRGGSARKAPRGNTDARRFAAWCEGRTGEPFIDANMRELAATGWMSNRGRQNVASYLVNDMGLDWRMGAYWFEHLLIDYDACSNWGNWQYLAGVGNDPREGRRFDPVRQAGIYDADGAFVRHWAE